MGPKKLEPLLSLECVKTPLQQLDMPVLLRCQHRGPAMGGSRRSAALLLCQVLMRSQPTDTDPV